MKKRRWRRAFCGIERRPLAAVCIGWMLVILIARFAGLPVFGEPALPEEVKAGIAMGLRTELTGEVESRQIKEHSIQYVLKNSSFTFRDKSYFLKRVQVTDTGGKMTCPVGALVRFHGALAQIGEARNPGNFEAREFYATLGIHFRFRADRTEIRGGGEGLGERMTQLRESMQAAQERALGEDAAGVLSAMVLGDRGMLTEDVSAGYRIAGIFHIICISGLHISLLGMLLFRALFFLFLFLSTKGKAKKSRAVSSMRTRVRAGRPLTRNGRLCAQVLAAGTATAVMAGYVIFAGAPPSAIRAVIMFGVMLVARLLGRDYDSMSALSLAGILILTTRPGYLFHSGFQLSFLAVAGAGGLYPLVRQRMPVAERHRVEQKSLYIAGRLREGFLQGLLLWVSVTAVTLPVVAWYYCEIPVWGLLANLLLVPLTGVVLVSGLAGSLAAVLGGQVIGGILFLPARGLLWIFAELAAFVQRLPAASWICGRPALWQVALYYGILCGAVLFACSSGKERMDRPLSERIMPQREKKDPWFRPRQVKVCLAQLLRCVVLSAVAVGILLWRPIPAFSIAMLDVGQGDAFVLRNGRHTFLVDGGSTSVSSVGKYRILPYLKCAGIRHIDGIFVTHADEDHYAGIRELLEEIGTRRSHIRLDAFFLPVWMREDGTGRDLAAAAAAAGAPTRYLQAGDVINAGDVKMRVLAPEHMPETDAEGLADVSGGPAMTGNEGSLVLHLQYGAFDALFTGDLEGAGEEAILTRLPDVDLLKVAHHGSRNSTSDEFLSHTRPEICLVSAPDGGRYGHPHQETLDRIAAWGADCYITRDAGAVTVNVQEGRCEVTTWIAAST